MHIKGSCSCLAYIWRICLLLPFWQDCNADRWFKTLEQELLVDIFKSSHPLSLSIWIYGCVLDFALDTFDKNIAFILSSKKVISLKQLREALERCDRSQNVFVFHKICPSGQWIQPQKVPLGFYQGSVIGDAWKKWMALLTSEIWCSRPCWTGALLGENISASKAQPQQSA